MAMDVYEPCPCGSGKKLKFCCVALADEMERIGRLIDNGQTRQAQQLLEQLDHKHPGNPWVITTRAIVLLENGDGAAARDLLRPFVSQHPDHDFAVVLLATAWLQADGLDAALPAIHRAFQRSARKFPSMVGGLAAAMSAVWKSRGRILASREHLALAMRFVPEQARQEIFVRLLEFDNDAGVPYPLRSVHPLPAITATEDLAVEVKKALKYSTVGCWNTAADLFAQQAEKHPQLAELQHCVGLCRAWEGDETAAAAALHRAAQLYADVGMAVECEVVAQLLDWNSTEKRRKEFLQSGKVSSVSRLLTALDADAFLARVELPPPDPNGEPLPTAVYQVLDRDRATTPPAEQLTIASAPRIVAHVHVFDADPETHEPPEVNVVGAAGLGFEESVERVRRISQDLVAWEAEPEEHNWIPEESLLLTWALWYPPKTPVALRRRLELQRWEQIVRQEWPNQALDALGGRSPRVAAADPAARVAVTAAVYALDAHCLCRGYELDVDGLLRELELPALEPVEVQPDTSLNSFSPLQWLRLPLDKLTDEQMLSVVNRALLVHHDRFLTAVLEAALQHENIHQDMDLPRLYGGLVEMHRQHGRRAAAFRWLEAGRAHAQAQPNNFQQIWSWDLRELLMRLEDPNDPQLRPLLDRFVQYYAPKLPQMRPYLEQMLAAAGVPSPWEGGGGIITPGAPPTTSGGLWTPESAAEPAAAGKLWVPGQ